MVDACDGGKAAFYSICGGLQKPKVKSPCVQGRFSTPEAVDGADRYTLLTLCKSLRPMWTNVSKMKYW